MGVAVAFSWFKVQGFKKMCEWLSHGEWCDVKLLCGGSAFSAHRAVLASVSNFLRQTLLSCPTDEWPTIIVLPEFDLEAMSSVLYYIYNGEVIIQKRKMDMFLEIIKALEIFIDHQCLPKFCEITDDNYVDFKRYSETNIRKNFNVFTLEFGNCEDQRYINIKKGQNIQNILLEYSLSLSDINDKRSQNWSEYRRNHLRNLKSPYGDRQRNSFLRDLFIETYPRNSNVNGLSTSVLAISNECYRAPTSVLLTNANGKHLSAGDALSEPNKNITGQISDLTVQYLPRRPLQCSQNDNQNCNQNFVKSDSDSRNSLELSQMDIFCGILEKESDMTTVQINHISKPTIPLASTVQHNQHLSKIQFPGEVSGSMQSTSHNMITNSRSLISFNEEFKKQCNVEENLCSNTAKVTILNQVLDNPWCPRIPVNCKPFRRKLQNPNTHLGQKDCKIRVETINDSNNNIKKSTPLTIDANIENLCLDEPKDLIVTSISSDISKEDFKCSICNQVFTCSDSLAVHTRRHSTSARYTCGECGKTFSQLRNFKYHMSVHRGTREFAATCTVCGKYFNDRGYLSSHMKIHRNRKEYKCTLCPKSFNQRVAYNMHVRIHTGVKPHVCEECGKAFSRKMLLKQHQRTHSGERPYACPHCDKRFADRSNMTLHLRLHSGVKPFSCSLCPKSFTKKHHLKSHLNFHTGSKPYSCPRCNLAFTQSSNMRTHMKKCTAPAPQIPDCEPIQS